MTRENRTTLWVKKETHRELKSRKEDGKTYDEQINELLNEE